MALSDLETRIADEISRTDLTSQIALEINSAIRFYQNKRFWFNSNVLVTLTTIQGQRDYTLPGNFASVLDVRSQLGNFTYRITPVTIQFLDSIDWGNNFIASYIDYFALFNGHIRLYPPPTAGLPIYVRGTVLLPTLTTTAATKSYAYNTAFSKNDTIVDQNGNIQTCITAGTTQAAPTKTYAANTAFTAADTVQDLNGNIQTCTTSGTSAYLLSVDATQWATSLNAVTTDGTGGLTWTLTSLKWSTNFDSYTVDGSVIWQLTNSLDTQWTEAAEELIRSRTIQQLYARYIKDDDGFGRYTQLTKDALSNLYEKNIGQSGLNIIRPHL